MIRPKLVLHARRQQPGLFRIVGNISAHSYLSFNRAERLPRFSHRLVSLGLVRGKESGPKPTHGAGAREASVLLLDRIAEGAGEILRDLGFATAERQEQPDTFGQQEFERLPKIPGSNARDRVQAGGDEIDDLRQRL